MVGTLNYMAPEQMTGSRSTARRHLRRRRRLLRTAERAPGFSGQPGRRHLRQDPARRARAARLPVLRPRPRDHPHRRHGASEGPQEARRRDYCDAVGRRPRASPSPESRERGRVYRRDAPQGEYRGGSAVRHACPPNSATRQPCRRASRSARSSFGAGRRRCRAGWRLRDRRWLAHDVTAPSPRASRRCCSTRITTRRASCANARRRPLSCARSKGGSTPRRARSIWGH